MESRFHRDLRLLGGIGASTAVLIAAVGYLALRGLRWEESSRVWREMAIYAAAGVGGLGAVAWWAWRVARRLKRPPGPNGRR